jgi:4-hydroxy-4-methyl-2-oxoglutarate aldolase
MIQINESVTPLPVEVIREAIGLSSGLISDAMSGFGVMDSTIKPVAPGMRLSGTAVTVNLRPGSNLALHLAIVLSDPGSVIVVSHKRDSSRAVLGGIMTKAAIKKGVAGIVVDGLVRDISELREFGLPVFARGAIPSAVEREGPGEMNVPISCGGIAVNPGDLILGDDDGIVAVPRSRIETVLNSARAKVTAEAQRVQEIENGKIIPEWLQKKIEEYGLGNPPKMQK